MLADPFHVSFLLFFQSHVRLFLNTFGLNLETEMGGRLRSTSEAVRMCLRRTSTTGCLSAVLTTSGLNASGTWERGRPREQ